MRDVDRVENAAYDAGVEPPRLTFLLRLLQRLCAWLPRLRSLILVDIAVVGFALKPFGIQLHRVHCEQCARAGQLWKFCFERIWLPAPFLILLIGQLDRGKLDNIFVGPAAEFMDHLSLERA